MFQHDMPYYLLGGWSGQKDSRGKLINGEASRWKPGLEVDRLRKQDKKTQRWMERKTASDVAATGSRQAWHKPEREVIRWQVLRKEGEGSRFDPVSWLG